ncbi:MAG: TauD/TfdA family dioxygenase [Acaryochloris sp. RU_4_1]|nr:TauD/TfdA family dioxygenase [Acaryochloris sp. RU_4_1]NJR53708.1 TauD/TfdA family dioxygenase [Acaryochloris sp. CRU_2_0]
MIKLPARGGSGSLQSRKRQAIQLSNETWVKVAPLETGGSLLLVISPMVKDISLLHWVAEHTTLIQEQLLKHGGILFRGFPVCAVAEFEHVIRTVAGELLDYRDRSSPRSSVEGKIYTSTDYPANQSIFLHSENSYAATWPLKIAFCCLTPPQQGGETPIADTRKLLQRIDPHIRDRFTQRGVMYVRNFGDGLGLSWQSVFQTEDPTQVEQFCQENAIELEWKSGNRLRTRQVRQAITQHPQTGEWVWFNHALFFHVSTLEPLLRQAILAEFSEADLPHHTYYGDGSPIEADVLTHLRQIYLQEQVQFPWQVGDILLLDNMLAAHGRMPYRGIRKVVVAMAEPMHYQDLNHSDSSAK